MTLEQLRIFVAVAEHLHMTRAAQALNMTQSGTSAAVAALETRYGTPLFHRIGRRIELTEAGQLFLPEARAVLQRAAAAELALNELSGLLRGSLSLHASQTIANNWLPPFLHTYHRRHPGIRIGLTIGNTAQVAAAVLAGEADLGFVEGEVDAPVLAKRAVYEDRLALVVGAAPDWPGAAEATAAAAKPGKAKSSTQKIAKASKSVDAMALKAMPWVLRERGSGTRQAAEDALKRFGLAVEDLDIALELPSNEAVRSAVAAGAGATIISRLVVAQDLLFGAVREIPVELPTRPFYVLRHGDRHRSKAEEALMSLIRGERK